MKDIQKFTYEKLIASLNKLDRRALYSEKAAVPDDTKLRSLLQDTTRFKDFGTKTVLGVDIYQYSQYHSLEQTIVPFLFKLIYREAARLCAEKAGFIFQFHKMEEFEKKFIDSGDGGFQIFETPLHAVVFAIHFELFVRYYNSYQFYPKLRKLVGPLNLRYALTHDQIYQFDNNFYGPCIINCNRILSKDELNRFLIDENTYNWFMLNMSGLENLQILSIGEIRRIKEFEEYKVQDGIDSIFPEEIDFDPKRSIIGVDVQKIGKIAVKSTSLSIYNVHMQYLGGLSNREDPEMKTWITLTLGNLNTSGIG
ncbi:MAG: hypothetical protein RIC15_06995 [Vicingaceae bacterium]